MVFLWSVVFVVTLVWSGIGCKDGPTWILEVFPAVAGAAVLAFTRKRFPFTPLAYILILAHSIILMIGGHYTYAEVPFFDNLGHWLGWSRNNYDKLGHFAQGLVPFIIAREILIRKQVIPSAAWRNFFLICFCLALSAFYELVEWWVAVLSGTGADAFLATQGYVWDTQSDMFFCLTGAVSALLFLSGWHDRQIATLPGNTEGDSPSRAETEVGSAFRDP